MADWNYKVVQGSIQLPVSITEQGATFRLSYYQSQEIQKEIGCFIPFKNGYLVNVIKEYFHEANKGKKVVVVGTDTFMSNGTAVLIVQKIHFQGLTALSKIKESYIDFSDD